MTAADATAMARQWLWFLWPVWPLALWTVWRWRRQMSRRHLSVPLVTTLVAMGASVAMLGSDRALMLALPGMAVLAAFALPTLKRSASAAIDWFSMFFFTLFAAWIWFIYGAIQTGWPAWQSSLIFRTWIPGYTPRFSVLALALAALGTIAWVWLVRWRTGRHREALWKSLVLPAGGVALCWMLAMTLWLQPLDYARSPRPLIVRLATLLPPGACVAAPGLSPAAVAAMEVLGRWRVDARPQAMDGPCNHLLRAIRSAAVPPEPAGWVTMGHVQRPTDREEVTWIYKRREP